VVAAALGALDEGDLVAPADVGNGPTSTGEEDDGAFFAADHEGQRVDEAELRTASYGRLGS
jgi:hypothetical protein